MSAQANVVNLFDVLEQVQLYVEALGLYNNGAVIWAATAGSVLWTILAVRYVWRVIPVVLGGFEAVCLTMARASEWIRSAHANVSNKIIRIVRRIAMWLFWGR